MRNDELDYLVKQLTGLDVESMVPGHYFHAEIICARGNLDYIRNLLIKESNNEPHLKNEGIYYLEGEQGNQKGHVIGLSATSKAAEEALRRVLFHYVEEKKKEALAQEDDDHNFSNRGILSSL